MNYAEQQQQRSEALKVLELAKKQNESKKVVNVAPKLWKLI